MIKNNLTTAVVAAIAGIAGFAGLANAVDLNPDGLGQVLIYPYFTVNNSQDTNISVVNTTDVGKVVKVRFLEGYNSREVLDFNLYLSAHDVWTAAISSVGDASTAAQIGTSDKSCLDFLPTNPYQFRPYGYDGTLAANGQPKDSGPQGVTRTREGYVEIISMGDIIPGTDLDAAITHEQDGTPNGGTPPSPPACKGLGALVPGALVAPTGGLFGSGAVVNVGQGTFFAYNAEAIDGFSEIVNYTDPSSLLPTLQDAATPSQVATGVARSYVFTNGGRLLTADYPNGRDAVSAVLMADAIYNEYFVDSNFGASSDWVITFPTKRFYVDAGLYPAATLPPFETKFASGVSNVLVAPSVYDREEGTPTTQSCPSPIGPECLTSNPNLPYEVNVLSFSSTSPAASTVFGSALFKALAPYGNAGWAELDLSVPGVAGSHVLTGGITPAGTPVTLVGLPVVGFYANNVINANASPGLLANYSGVWRHKAHRSCTGDDAACS